MGNAWVVQQRPAVTWEFCSKVRRRGPKLFQHSPQLEMVQASYSFFVLEKRFPGPYSFDLLNGPKSRGSRAGVSMFHILVLGKCHPNWKTISGLYHTERVSLWILATCLCAQRWFGPISSSHLPLGLSHVQNAEQFSQWFLSLGWSWVCDSSRHGPAPALVSDSSLSGAQESSGWKLRSPTCFLAV